MNSLTVSPILEKMPRNSSLHIDANATPLSNEVDITQTDEKTLEVSEKLIVVKKKKRNRKSKANRNRIPPSNANPSTAITFKKSYDTTLSDNGYLKKEMILESELSDQSKEILLRLLNSENAIPGISPFRNVSYIIYNSVLALRGLDFHYSVEKDKEILTKKNQTENDMKIKMEKHGFKFFLFSWSVDFFQGFNELRSLVFSRSSTESQNVENQADVSVVSDDKLSESEFSEVSANLEAYFEEVKRVYMLRVDTTNFIKEVIDEAQNKLDWFFQQKKPTTQRKKSVISQFIETKNLGVKVQIDKHLSVLIDGHILLSELARGIEKDFSRLTKIEKFHSFEDKGVDTKKHKQLFLKQVREAYVSSTTISNSLYSKKLLEIFDKQMSSCECFEKKLFSLETFFDFFTDERELRPLINNVREDSKLNLLDRWFFVMSIALHRSCFYEKTKNIQYKIDNASLAKNTVLLKELGELEDNTDLLQIHLIEFLTKIKNNKLLDAFEEYFQEIHSIHQDSKSLFNDTYLKQLDSILKDPSMSNIVAWFSLCMNLRSLSPKKDQFINEIKNRNQKMSDVLCDLVKSRSITEEDVTELKQNVQILTNQVSDLLSPYLELISEIPQLVYPYSELPHEIKKSKTHTLVLNLDKNIPNLFAFKFPVFLNGSLQVEKESVLDEEKPIVGLKNKSKISEKTKRESKIHEDISKSSHSEKNEAANIIEAKDEFERPTSKEASALIGFLVEKGWKFVHQKGSHIKLELNEKYSLTVPVHKNKKELKTGTFHAILKQAFENSQKEFTD